jgi:hypothetical protein
MLDSTTITARPMAITTISATRITATTGKG